MLLRRVLLLTILVLAPALAPSVESRARNVSLGPLKTAVNTQVRAAKQSANRVGVHIMTVDDSSEIYSYSGDRQHILASNTKLFTSAAALDILGPGYFFETPVMLRGQTVDGTLMGDLGIVGGGDPNISGRLYNGDSYGAFREWARELRRVGIQRISGEIVLASGLFSDAIVHPDWPKDQLDRWYEAPVASLSFNDNCVLVKAEPKIGPGGAPRVSLVPDIPYFNITGTLQNTGTAKSQWVKIARNPRASTTAGRRSIEVSGRIYRGTEGVDKWVTVDDPVLYFGSALKHALAQEGIQVEGQVVEVERLAGADWRTLMVHRTDLLTTLGVVNKRSQNFFAESVLKTLGAERCDDGSWDAGLRVVREMLSEAGLDAGEYQLADGSGMSRNNRATPRQVTHLLRHMFHHPTGAEFIRTLPYSGERDLSWSKRLANAPYRGNVMAKTGTLNGVSTLSGYAKGRSGTVYAFSILMNETRQNWRAKTAQNAILRALIDHG